MLVLIILQDAILITFYLFIKVEQLVIQEFTSKTFTVADAPNWSSSYVNLCANTGYSEFGNSNVFGIFGQNQSSTKKTVNSLPPHWSVSIRFDMLLYQSMDPNDYVNIQVDTESVQTFKKNGYTEGYNMCGSQYGDILIMYNKNFTHTLPSLTMKIDSIMDEPIANEGFVMKNLFIYVDTCHQSCATCKGPNSDQCLTCPPNSSQSGNKCTCIPPFYSHQFTCVSACPTGFVPDSTDKICVVDFCATSDCQNCVNKVCTACKSGKKLFLGQCVLSCPSYAPEQSGVCKDISTNLSNGEYLMKGLFSDNFGESEVYGLGLVTSGFLGTAYLTESGAKVTRCNDKHLLGGAYLSSKGSSISRTFNGLPPHWSVVIGYTLYKIDTWDSEKVEMNVDGDIKQTTQRNHPDGAVNLCGVASITEDVIYVSKNFTHIASTMNLKITTNLDEIPFNESYGIREIFVLVDKCTSNCSSCNASGCLSCNSGYFLYQNVCFQTCPSGSYQNSSTTCASCDSTCKECSSPGTNKSCTKCNNGFYLNPDKSCQATCPTSYWQRTSDLTCQSCDSSCKECNSPGTNISCTKCNSGTYLNPDKSCQSTCPTSYWQRTSDLTCQTCDSSCKECASPGTNKSCTKCNTGAYLNPDKSCQSTCPTSYWQKNSDLTCQSCDSSCYNCKSPGDGNSCSACSGSLYLLNNQCVSQCGTSYFKISAPNNNTCQKCESSCLTCDGDKNNNCLTCQGPSLFWQSSTKTCVTTCNTNQFKNINNQQCSSCDPSCATCSGGLNNNCLSCQGTLFLDKLTNTCVPKCPNNYFPNAHSNECWICHSTCATCNGGSESDCLTCSGDRFYQKLTKKCVLECNTNQYKDKSSQECNSCDKSCTTCDGATKNSCLSCSESTFLDKSNKQCVQTCPDGFYANKTNNECSKCDQTCKTCENGTSKDCLSCDGNRFHVKQSNECVEQCPISFYGEQNPVRQCLSCHYKCRTGCHGPDDEDCDNIKIQYQMLFYILSFKSGLWVLSFVWGIFKDRKTDKFKSSVKPDSPAQEDEQKIQEQSDTQKIEPTKLQKKVSIEDELKENQDNKDGTLNNIDLYSKQQTMTNLNLNNGNGFDPTARRQFRRMRSQKLTNFTSRSNTIILDSPAQLTLNPLKKMSSDIESSDQAITLTETKLKYTTITTRSGLQMSSLFSQKSQENMKISSNQKLKYTILGNEWISLLRLNDPLISRANRATLIFLKYQAFFFSTQYIYDYSVKYIALCLLIGWSVKFVLSKLLSLVASSSSKFGNILANFIFSGLLFCHFFFWFIPQLMSLFIDKDKQWSVFYSMIFSADLVLFQQVFSFFEYILTIKYLNVKKEKGMKTLLLKFFKSDLLIRYIKK